MARLYDDDKVAALISRALQEKPEHGGDWTVRLMAEAEGGFEKYGASVVRPLRYQAVPEQVISDTFC